MVGPVIFINRTSDLEKLLNKDLNVGTIVYIP